VLSHVGVRWFELRAAPLTTASTLAASSVRGNGKTRLVKYSVWVVGCVERREAEGGRRKAEGGRCQVSGVRCQVSGVVQACSAGCGGWYMQLRNGLSGADASCVVPLLASPDECVGSWNIHCPRLLVRMCRHVSAAADGSSAKTHPPISEHEGRGCENSRSRFDSLRIQRQTTRLSVC